MIAVPLSADLVADVAARMRASDRREVSALCWPGCEAPHLLAVEAVDRSRFGGVILGPAGLPECALGAIEMWPGVWQVWLIATDAWPAVWRSVVRFCRRVLRPCLIGAGLHRAQCFADADNLPAHRLLRRLGFVNETPGGVRRFGRDGSDFLLFGAIA